MCFPIIGEVIYYSKTRKTKIQLRLIVMYSRVIEKYGKTKIEYTVVFVLMNRKC